MIELTSAVGRRFRCTMRVDCGQLDPGAVIQPIRSEWHPHMPAINGRFAVDSLLEQAGFELSVPPERKAFPVSPAFGDPSASLAPSGDRGRSVAKSGIP